MIHYWSYILAPFGLWGMWSAGKRKRSGWLVSISTQILWLIYAVQTQQWGFIPGSAAYMIVYVKSYWEWGHGERKGDQGSADGAVGS